MPLHSGQKKDVSMQGTIDGACKWVNVLGVPRAYDDPRGYLYRQAPWWWSGASEGVSVGVWTH